MPSLNIMLVARSDSKALDLILNSKYLDKLYTNFEYENATNISFNTFQELAEKCKTLKVDIVIVDNKKFILQGIADVLKKNFVNCIALNSFWTQLILSNRFAREMMKKYEIETPDILAYPKEFPLVVRADGMSDVAHSMTQLIGIRQQIAKYSQGIADTIVLEKFIEGKEITLTSFFDGKTLITFPDENLNDIQICEYNMKLENMFVNENPNFIGYIDSKLIVAKQNLFNIGFDICFPEFKEDLLFILINAIYQKLNETII